MAGVGYDSTVINVIPGSAAEAAGMEDGDQITSIGGSHTFLYREVSLYSTLHQGQTAEVTYKRDGESYKVTLTPLQSENGAYLYGFSKSVYRDKGNVFQVFGYSGAEVRYWMKATVESLSMLVCGQVGLNEMSGPLASWMPSVRLIRNPVRMAVLCGYESADDGNSPKRQPGGHEPPAYPCTGWRTAGLSDY